MDVETVPERARRLLKVTQQGELVCGAPFWAGDPRKAWVRDRPSSLFVE